MDSVFDNSYRKQFMTKRIDKIIFLLSVKKHCYAEEMLYDLNKTTDINFNYIIDELKSKNTLNRLINWRQTYL